MWDFMKPKGVRPVCQTQPTHDAIKQLENYRRYVLESIDCYYKQIVEQLSVTDPASLATLNDAIKEYKEILNSIETKSKQMEEELNSFLAVYKSSGIKDLRLHCEYDSTTRNLSYRIGEKEG